MTTIMNTITVILEKNPTTGYWKAFVLQDGVRGRNLCTHPTTAATARAQAERTIHREGFTGKINFIDGAAVP